ncbi:MAG: type II toxin-antitoxin system VapC family toxin [Prevotellaceae bacterium]|jgi:tRNA(fMet)-specific endonuclease VapC|nr:type II toxin-antitoxin system VapC family toxin [Prevotellaceae bacterium]
MQYLLDTNICVFFFRNKYGIADVLRTKGVENCSVSEITVAELRYGAENSSNPQKQHQLLDTFLQRIAVIPITDSIRTYAVEKARLKKAGTPIHDEFDLLIGASAMHYGLTLVTDNMKDFKHLAGIKVENWIKR